MSVDGENEGCIETVVHWCAFSFAYSYVPRLLFMKRLFWKHAPTKVLKIEEKVPIPVKDKP